MIRFILQRSRIAKKQWPFFPFLFVVPKFEIIFAVLRKEHRSSASDGAGRTKIHPGTLAQLVEQRTENLCVPGSIPGGTT